jgi:hypothetical protein
MAAADQLEAARQLGALKAGRRSPSANAHEGDDEKRHDDHRGDEHWPHEDRQSNRARGKSI